MGLRIGVGKTLRSHGGSSVGPQPTRGRVMKRRRFWVLMDRRNTWKTLPFPAGAMDLKGMSSTKSLRHAARLCVTHRLAGFVIDTSRYRPSHQLRKEHEQE